MRMIIIYSKCLLTFLEIKKNQIGRDFSQPNPIKIQHYKDLLFFKISEAITG